MVVSLPSAFKIQKSTFGLDHNEASFRSPFTGRIDANTRDSRTNRWTGSFTILPTLPADTKAIEAFITDLRGQEGTFSITDPARKTPVNAPGPGLVKGASQGGNILLSDGWPSSATLLLKGELFSVDDHIYQLSEDIVSVGTDATLLFQPPLKTTPADNAAIITDSPPMVVRLAKRSLGITKSPAFGGGFVLDWTEAL